MDPSIRPITREDRFKTHELYTRADLSAGTPDHIKRQISSGFCLCKHCHRWGDALFEKTCAEWQELK